MFPKRVRNRHFARHYAVMVLVMFLGIGWATAGNRTSRWRSR